MLPRLSTKSCVGGKGTQWLGWMLLDFWGMCLSPRHGCPGSVVWNACGMVWKEKEMVGEAIGC